MAFLIDFESRFLRKLNASKSLLTFTPEHKYFLFNGIPEKGLIDWVKTLVQPSWHFVDVGCHIGTWSIEIAPLVDKVTAFEAHRTHVAFARANVALRMLHEKVRVHELALSDKCEKKEYVIRAPCGGGNGLLLRDEDNELPSYEVETKTLDSLGLGTVDLLKIDVEGFELQVLKGAASLVKQYKPMIFVESWPADRFEGAGKLQEELFEFIQNEFGYCIRPLVSHNEMFICTPP